MVLALTELVVQSMTELVVQALTELLAPALAELVVQTLTESLGQSPKELVVHFLTESNRSFLEINDTSTGKINFIERYNIIIQTDNNNK